jgi:hypothetical protein
VSGVRVRRHTDGRVAISRGGRWHTVSAQHPWVDELEVSGPGWCELLVAELPEPEGGGGWLLSNGADLTAEPGGVSFDGDDPVPPDVWRADALKMLAAVAACERHRAGVKS